MIAMTLHVSYLGKGHILTSSFHISINIPFSTSLVSKPAIWYSGVSLWEPHALHRNTMPVPT